MNKALDKAELIANKNGICIVGIKNSNHFGITGYYCERLAKIILYLLDFQML